jgi:hypothetical protein
LDVSGDGDVDSSEFLAWYFDVDDSKPEKVVPPDTRGILEKEPAATEVSTRVGSRFARFLKKPFARDPAKQDRAKPKQVLPEDFLVRARGYGAVVTNRAWGGVRGREGEGREGRVSVHVGCRPPFVVYEWQCDFCQVVTQPELGFEVQAFVGRVDPVKGTLPPPYRPLDLTRHVDPRPEAVDPEVVAAQAREKAAAGAGGAGAGAGAGGTGDEVGEGEDDDVEEGEEGDEEGNEEDEEDGPRSHPS